MGLGLLDGEGEGLVVLALVTLMLGVSVGGVLYQHEIAAALRRLAARLRPPLDHPVGRPVELIARDARRLRAELLATTPGTPMARRVGVQRAYDDVLADACQALGVPDTLSGLPLGTDRDVERLRVEHELDAAGLRLGA